MEWASAWPSLFTGTLCDLFPDIVIIWLEWWFSEVVPGLAAPASSGDLLEIQIPRSGYQPTESNSDRKHSFLSFSMPCLCCQCTLKFEDIAYEVRVAGSNSEVATDLILSSNLTDSITNGPHCSSERFGYTAWLGQLYCNSQISRNLDWKCFQ